MGTMHFAGAAPVVLAATGKTTSSPVLFYVFIALIFVAMYVLMIRPQRKRREQMQQRQQQVVPGTKVRTTAGLYGTVVSGDDYDIVLEIAPGVRVKMLRRAIMDVLDGDQSTPNGQYDQPHFEDSEPVADETPHDDGGTPAGGVKND